MSRNEKLNTFTYTQALERLYCTTSTTIETGITRKEAYMKLKELIFADVEMIKIIKQLREELEEKNGQRNNYNK